MLGYRYKDGDVSRLAWRKSSVVTSTLDSIRFEMKAMSRAKQSSFFGRPLHLPLSTSPTDLRK